MGNISTTRPSTFAMMKIILTLKKTLKKDGLRTKKSMVLPQSNYTSPEATFWVKCQLKALQVQGTSESSYNQKSNKKKETHDYRKHISFYNFFYLPLIQN